VINIYTRRTWKMNKKYPFGKKGFKALLKQRMEQLARDDEYMAKIEEEVAGIKGRLSYKVYCNDARKTAQEEVSRLKKKAKNKKEA